jgi:hypothetical protein
MIFAGFPPTAPTLAVVSGGVNHVRLRRGTVPHSTGYEVQRATNAAFTAGVVTVPMGLVEADITGLTPGVQHWFRVRAVNGGGAGPWSAAVTAHTPPATPALTLGSVGVGSVALTRSASAGATSFELQRATNAAFTAGVETVAMPAAELVLGNLPFGTQHWFRVRAVGPGGTSPWSNAATATPLHPAPTAPTLTLGAVGMDTVNLTRTTPANATSFELQRATNAAFTAGLVTVAMGATTLASAGLAAGTQHWFRVRAVGPGGTSPWSAVVTAHTVPAAPTLTLGLVTDNTVNLTRSTPANTTSFELQRATNANFTQNLVTVPMGSTTGAITGLNANTGFWFRVRARTGTTTAHPWSAWSNVVSTTTAPVAPTVELTGDGTHQNGIAIARNTPAGATRFELQRATNAAFTQNLVTVPMPNSIGRVTGAATIFVRARAGNATTWGPWGPAIQINCAPAFVLGATTFANTPFAVQRVSATLIRVARSIELGGISPNMTIAGNGFFVRTAAAAAQLSWDTGTQTPFPNQTLQFNTTAAAQPWFRLDMRTGPFHGGT